MPSSTCRKLVEVLGLICFSAGLFAQASPGGLPPPHSPATNTKQSPGKITHIDYFGSWLEEDVRWIVTDEERTVFQLLKNDEEREQFIEQFWLRRDPTPETLENEYKEEHYRRMVYANEQFASATPGWSTDRGRIYIMYGPPDQIESHPFGASGWRPSEEGGGEVASYPFETWRYRYVEGVGQEIEVEFVDTCRCGDYRMTLDSSNGGQMHVAGSAQSRWRQDALARIRIMDRNPKTPPQRAEFKNLEDVVGSPIRASRPPFQVHTDFFRITKATDWVRFTLELRNKNVVWKESGGRRFMKLKLAGRVIALTGRIAALFEDAIEDSIESKAWPAATDGTHLYWRTLALAPGRYRADLRIEDLNGQEAGTWSRSIVVPGYNEPNLATSSLILADRITPSKQSMDFALDGAHPVRPRLESPESGIATFKRAEALNIWMQVYNLAIDAKTHWPRAAIEYDIVNSSNQRTALHMGESTEQLGKVGEQITLQKFVPLNDFEPGHYQVTINVGDVISSQIVTATSAFLVQ